MQIERISICKVNLLLNILSKRTDGFHDLETILQPVPVADRLEFSLTGTPGIVLTCSEPRLPADASNLVHRAAAAFLKAAPSGRGIRIHLEKRVPLAAGLGGGSSNAANTLLALNQLHENCLPHETLESIAAGIGSDVPFFLQSKPALATGRGDRIQSLEPFPALAGRAILLIHPGLGVSTPWAYKNLARFPNALPGVPRASALLDALQRPDPGSAAGLFYNTLELPVLHKYPLLRMYQETLIESGAIAAMMSGSGSTTFAISDNEASAQRLLDRFKRKFGERIWSAIGTVL